MQKLEENKNNNNEIFFSFFVSRITGMVAAAVTSVATSLHLDGLEELVALLKANQAGFLTFTQELSSISASNWVNFMMAVCILAGMVGVYVFGIEITQQNRRILNRLYEEEEKEIERKKRERGEEEGKSTPLLTADPNTMIIQMDRIDHDIKEQMEELTLKYDGELSVDFLQRLRMLLLVYKGTNDRYYSYTSPSVV
jgi:hypothetical protein